MARYGIEVAEGRDVGDASDQEKLYDSSFQSPKILAPLTGSFTTDGSGNATTPVSHGLTYSPIVFAYYKRPDGKWYATDNDLIAAETSTTSVTLRAAGLVAATAYPYKFWVFTDPAQEI